MCTNLAALSWASVFQTGGGGVEGVKLESKQKWYLVASRKRKAHPVSIASLPGPHACLGRMNLPTMEFFCSTSERMSLLKMQCARERKNRSKRSCSLPHERLEWASGLHFSHYRRSREYICPQVIVTHPYLRVCVPRLSLKPNGQSHSQMGNAAVTTLEETWQLLSCQFANHNRITPLVPLVLLWPYSQ